MNLPPRSGAAVKAFLPWLAACLLLGSCHPSQKSVEWREENWDGVPVRRCMSGPQTPPLAVTTLLISGTGTMESGTAEGARLMRFVAENLALSGVDSVWVLSADPECDYGRRTQEVKAVVDRLAAESSDKLVCIGHSEGCLVGLGLLGGEPRIQSFVGLSCPLLPGSEFALDQAEGILRLQNYDAETREAYAKYLREAYPVCADLSVPREAAQERLAGIQKRALAPLARHPALASTTACEEQRAQLLSPRSRSFLAFDAGGRLAASTQPVLLVYGGLDKVMNARRNMERLKQMPERGVEGVMFPDVDHSLRKAGHFDFRAVFKIFEFLKRTTSGG